MTEEEFASLPDEVRRSLNVRSVYRGAIDEMKSSINEAMDFITGAARSLLVAHGAGLITSVQLLVSDHPEKLGKVPMFGAAFALGFLLAAAASFFLYYARIELTPTYPERESNSFRVYLALTAAPLGASLIVLIASVGLIGLQLYKI